MLEIKNQALNLFENMEAKDARFVGKEKEYEDYLNKIGVEVEVNSILELSLMDEVMALRM